MLLTSVKRVNLSIVGLYRAITFKTTDWRFPTQVLSDKALPFECVNGSSVELFEPVPYWFWFWRHCSPYHHLNSSHFDLTCIWSQRGSNVRVDGLSCPGLDDGANTFLVIYYYYLFIFCKTKTKQNALVKTASRVHSFWNWLIPSCMIRYLKTLTLWGGNIVHIVHNTQIQF